MYFHDTPLSDVIVSSHVTGKIFNLVSTIFDQIMIIQYNNIIRSVTHLRVMRWWQRWEGRS